MFRLASLRRDSIRGNRESLAICNLDFVRLSAAVLVVFGHAFNFTGGHFRFLAGHGAASVAVFFVLSGFVIAFVTDKKERCGCDFAIARASRMYSVSLGALLVTICADQIGTFVNMTPYSGYAIGSEEGHVLNIGYFNPNWRWIDLLRLATYTNELWQSHVQVGSNEPYWSLGFEVWYYIIFGLYLFGPGGRKVRFACAAIAALIAGPKICLYLPLWLLGVMCYRLLAAPSPFLLKVPNGFAVALFVSTGALYLLARRYLAPQTQSMFLPVGLNMTTLMTALHFHFVGLLFCLNLICFYIFALRVAWMPALVHKYKKPIQWAAGATFSLYLAHQPLLLMCLALNPLKWGSAAWAYSSVAGTFFLVFLLAQFTERKKDFWKRCFESLLRFR